MRHQSFEVRSDAEPASSLLIASQEIIMANKSRKSSKSSDLQSSDLQLGRAVEWPQTPGEAKLDRVVNPQADTNYMVRFTAPEFTSLCPITGQPDFAHFVIDYVPNRKIVESTSIKLFLFSFSNHGAFDEDCTVMIGKRIVSEIKT